MTKRLREDRGRGREERETEREGRRERVREVGLRGRVVGREGQRRAPHVSPKTVGKPHCYAMTHGPTNGHPNLL